MFISIKLLFRVILVVGIVHHSLCTLSKSDRKSNKAKKSTQHSTVRESVQPELLSETTNDILHNHSSFNQSLQDVKTFTRPVLAYVTPWNNHGYDVAKWFGAKFDLVSPVWLQIRRRTQSDFYITGDHDIDRGWIAAVRQKGSKIVPRLLFDGWRAEDYQSVLFNEYVAGGCARTISQFIEKNDFDGLVLEVWSQLGGQVRRELSHFLTHISEELHAVNKLFILVIPPPVYDGNQQGMFDGYDFSELEPYVDYFSLMTYDFSNPMKPGPNSPLSWVEKCVRLLVPNDHNSARGKILLGLNFYGNVYSNGDGQPILGSRLVQILENHPPTMHWDETSGEHTFKYRDGSKDYIVYYPTRQSIRKRLDLAKRLQVGISIWEIGQGLDYFYDLL